MTGEPESPTEAWVEKHGAKFAYAYDKKKSLSRKLGVRGIPHSFLVDPSGKIVWRGHPAGLTAEIVKQHTQGALPLPLWKWPKEVKSIRDHLLKRRLGKALLAADKLVATNQELTNYRDTVRKMIDSGFESLETMHKAGDFLGARDLANSLKKQLTGLPDAAKAAETLKAIQADPTAKSIMSAQKRLVALKKRELKKVKDYNKAIKAAKRLAKKHPDTFVGKEAEKLASQLEERRRKR